MVSTPDTLPVFDDRAIIDDGQIFFLGNDEKLASIPTPSSIDPIYHQLGTTRFWYAYDVNENDWKPVPIPVSPISESTEFEIFLKMADNVRTVMKGVTFLTSDYLISATIDTKTGNLNEDYPVVDNKNILFKSRTDTFADVKNKMYMLKSYKGVRYTALS